MKYVSSIPGYLTFTHGGIPDRQIIEGYSAAMERARREGEMRAIQRLKQAVVDVEIKKLIELMEKGKTT